MESLARKMLLSASLVGISFAPAFAADVTTIAGNGRHGMQDGPALQASFIYPDGIAVARDGSVYISDRDAQRIRVLTPQGEVKTVAGSGDISGRPGLSVPHGYADGPAHAARFAGPAGLAIGPDGALYIADVNNSCIRKLWHDQVTTVLGVPGSGSAAVDGDVKRARLVHPRALAFDPAGNMYIADDGGGLRKWSNGVLRTIHLHDYVDPKNALGVAYFNDPTDPIVSVTSREGLFVYHTATGKDDGYAARGAFEGDLPTGVPNQLAFKDRRQLYYTDLMMSTVNYARLPAKLFAGKLFARTVAGSLIKWPSSTAGYADGERYTARFYNPMGIAIVGNYALVADGGNRRIRKMALPHTTVSEAGLDPANVVDDQHFEIGFLGASWTFWDSLGDDSICAAMERTFNHSGRFKKPARCHTVRIDAAVSQQSEDYIKNVFPYERMDLVILDAESWYDHPPDLVVPGSTPGTTTTWGALFKQHMQELLDVLTPLNTKLALVSTYPPYEISVAEFPVEDVGQPRSLPYDVHYVTATAMMDVLKGMPIYQYDAYMDLTNYEKSLNARPLYQSYDPHPNPRGNEFLGTHFAQGLLDAGLGNS